MSTKITVAMIDSKLLARAQAQAEGICKTQNELADYQEAVRFGASRGILPEELKEWPLWYVSPRRVYEGLKDVAPAKAASKFWAWCRTTNQYEKAKAYRAAKEAAKASRSPFVDDTPTEEDDEDRVVDTKRPPAMRPRLGGCMVVAEYDLEGRVVGWVGRVTDPSRSLAEIAGDYYPDEADVVLGSKDGKPIKYRYLPATRSNVSDYGSLGRFETPATNTGVPLLLSPRLIAERKSGWKNAATVPIWVCEGVFDGVLAQLGGVASIATHGAWCYQEQVTALVGVLREAAGNHYKVYLCFDKDPSRWDPYRRLAMGPGQRGACLLLTELWRLAPQLARAIQVVELPSRPDGSKLDLGDLLAGATASVKTPTPTGDPELEELEREERAGYVAAVKAARRKLLDKLALGAKSSRKYPIAQIPAVVDIADRSAILRETSLMAMAMASWECFESIAPEVAPLLGYQGAYGLRTFLSDMKKKVKGAKLEQVREEADEGDIERFRRPDGTLKPCFDAYRSILGGSHKGRLKWNEMELSVSLDGVPLTIEVEGDLESWLSRKHLLDGPIDTLKRAIGVVAHHDKYHPVKDWLRKLKWEQGDDILRWQREICATLGKDLASADRFERLECVMILKFILSAVARALDPGCKVDCMLVLQGKQGAHKDQFFEALCFDKKWFSNQQLDPDPKNKDERMKMRKYWIIHNSDVDQQTWYENSVEWKGFVTCAVDGLRPPYGDKVLDYPRTSVMCGSTNTEKFLSDPTGSRRWWVVKVADGWIIDKERVTACLEQLLAHAVATFDDWVERGSDLKECPWWLTPSEDEVHRELNARYEVENLERSKIITWLESSDHKTVTNSMIAADCLKLERGELLKASRRIGVHMQAIGWPHGDPVRGVVTYVRPENWALGPGHIRTACEVVFEVPTDKTVNQGSPTARGETN